MKYEWSFGGATFKRRLIVLMEEKALSQQAIADAAGVSQGTVSRWLAGSVPDLDHVTALAGKAAVPVAWLAYGEGHLKIKYDGVDGFIHRAKNKVLPRLKETVGKLFELQHDDFLSPEEKDIVEDLQMRLGQRRFRVAECVEALEKLPPGDESTVVDVLAKIKGLHSIPDKRLELCVILGLSSRALDEEILESCRALLKEHPFTSRTRTGQPASPPVQPLPRKPRKGQ